jgi:peptidoglycan/xylan/chitin deacetylase (PgdA/CDA1 family)
LQTRWHPAPFLAFSIGVHLAALVAFALRPSAWPWIVSFVVADHLVITAAGLWPRSRLLGPNLTRLPPAAIERRQVAITIDDGPDPEVTPQVLDILAAARVHATFFCIGERALRHPDLCRRIAAEGHAVENHGHRHRVGTAFLGIRGWLREAGDAQRALTGITGRPPRYFRALAGLRNPFLEPALVKAGLRLASWTRRGFDTRESDARRVHLRLARNLAAGDILLLHDGHAARTAAGVPLIVAVLPGLLEEISAKGLVAVTLEEAGG